MAEELIIEDVDVISPRLFLSKPGRRTIQFRGATTGKVYRPRSGRRISSIECEKNFIEETNWNTPINPGSILHICGLNAPGFAAPDCLVKVVRIIGEDDRFVELEDRAGQRRTFSLFEAAMELEATEYKDWPA